MVQLTPYTKLPLACHSTRRQRSIYKLHFMITYLVSAFLIVSHVLHNNAIVSWNTYIQRGIVLLLIVICITHHFVCRSELLNQFSCHFLSICYGTTTLLTCNKSRSWWFICELLTTHRYRPLFCSCGCLLWYDGSQGVLDGSKPGILRAVTFTRELYY